jgi:hypothetical protein
MERASGCRLSEGGWRGWLAREASDGAGERLPAGEGSERRSGCRLAAGEGREASDRETSSELGLGFGRRPLRRCLLRTVDASTAADCGGICIRDLDFRVRRLACGRAECGSWAVWAVWRCRVRVSD